MEKLYKPKYKIFATLAIYSFICLLSVTNRINAEKVDKNANQIEDHNRVLKLIDLFEIFRCVTPFPTQSPTLISTASPSISDIDSQAPSQLISEAPSLSDSPSTSNFPSESPSISESPTTSAFPTFVSDSPTLTSSNSPSTLFSESPSSLFSELPSSFYSESPSQSPSSTPADRVLSCPNEDADPFSFRVEGTIQINMAPSNKLCILTIKRFDDGENTTIPLGRSYENQPWETSPGPYFLSLKFNCDDSSCTTNNLPDRPADYVFQLSTYSFSQRNPKSQDIAARFLEQTTFGPTREALEPWKDLSIASSSDLDRSFANWVDDQIHNKPLSSHREYFRKNMNLRLKKTVPFGVPLHPCDPMTRWHSYAFTTSDSNNSNEITNDSLKIEIERTSDNSAYLLSIQGESRTEVQSIQLLENPRDNESIMDINLEVPGSYSILPENNIRDHVGGVVGIYIDADNRQRAYLKTGNPLIQFTSTNPKLPTNVITLNPEDRNNFSPIAGSYSGNEFMLFDGLSHSMCSQIKVGSYPVYIDFTDGNYLAFDPRLSLIENTVENPSSDGGGSKKNFGGYCANAPRTFVNEESCVVSSEPDVCRDSYNVPDIEIKLTSEAIRTIYELTGRYIYAIDGLRPTQSPCYPNSSSKWIRIGDASLCTANNGLSDATTETLQDHLSWADFEGDLRRMWFGEDGRVCDIPSTTPSDTVNVQIIFDQSCWQLAHPNHHDVYDFTPWVIWHPGGGDEITVFADAGLTELQFPGHHEMWRWEYNVNSFSRVGTFNQFQDFRDIPIHLQTKAVGEALAGDYVEKAQTHVVCGSPYEVANDPTLGETPFGEWMGNNINDFTWGDLDNQKQLVWINTVLRAEDQLRQRMAWAISQLFPVDYNTLGGRPRTEHIVTYYDIFVRHAFGNYFDILKEVSYR